MQNPSTSEIGRTLLSYGCVSRWRANLSSSESSRVEIPSAILASASCSRLICDLKSSIRLFTPSISRTMIYRTEPIIATIGTINCIQSAVCTVNLPFRLSALVLSVLWIDEHIITHFGRFNQFKHLSIARYTKIHG